MRIVHTCMFVMFKSFSMMQFLYSVGCSQELAPRQGHPLNVGLLVRARPQMGAPLGVISASPSMSSECEVPCHLA